MVGAAFALLAGGYLISATAARAADTSRFTDVFKNGLVPCGHQDSATGERPSDTCTIEDIFKAVARVTNFLIGFAGALTPDLKVGDIIEPDQFIEQDYNAEPFEKFPNIIKRNQKKLLRDSLDAVMLTQDKFLKENPYKDGPYAKKYKRLACDMESYAVAHFCEMARVNYHVVKLISDSADESADHDFLKACRELSPRLNSLVLESIQKIHEISRRG